MFKNSSKILFLLILLLGTIISISSNSWLSAWMGLEINLLAFIPLMTSSRNLMSSEASLKYFLTQALASSILLFSSLLLLTHASFDLLISLKNIDSMPNWMILSSLLLKSGAAPFHFWFPSVMEGLSWINGLVLMTWQKVAPLMLSAYLISKTLIFPIVITSVIIGSIGGLNQTSLRKIMAFSSINHLGWMLAAMVTSETLWLTYFTIYSLLSFNLVFFFYTFEVSHLNHLFSMFSESKIMKFTTFMNLLSLGGLPPFLGFIPKWLVIQSLTINNQIMLMILMTALTLITLFYYIRLCYSAFTLNFNETNWMISPSFKPLMMKAFLMFSFLSNLGLFSICLLFLPF